MARHGFYLTWAITENGVQGKSGEIADAVKYIEINITPEDLAALGYVTWKPVSEKPEYDGQFPAVIRLWDGKIAAVVGELFENGKWVGSHEVLYWLPLPALPGKGIPE